MPTYDYVCYDLKGKFTRGTTDAVSRHELIISLWEKGLFLVLWRELLPAGSPAPEGKSKTKPKAAPPSPPAFIPEPAFSGNLLDRIYFWIADHSFGAVTSKPQAIAVILLSMALVSYTLYNYFYHFGNLGQPPNVWKGQIPPSG